MQNSANLFQKSNFILASPKWDFFIGNITEVNIPGISFSHAEAGGSRYGSRLHVQGDSITFNNLSVTILVDEDLEVYRNLTKFIFNAVSPNNGKFSIQEFPLLLLINNNKGNYQMTLEFANAKIESIGDIQLSSQDDGPVSQLSLEIKYDYYTIVTSAKVFDLPVFASR